MIQPSMRERQTRSHEWRRSSKMRDELEHKHQAKAYREDKCSEPDE
jgi:hypothetical protein